MRSLMLLALAVLAACDPCSAVLQVHIDRCAAGDSESCLWVDGYMAAGTCPG